MCILCTFFPVLAKLRLLARIFFLQPLMETYRSGMEKAKETAGRHYEDEAQLLRERLVYLAMDVAPPRGTYAYLEQRTGIKASKWKNLFLLRQMPTVEMLVAICSQRSEFVHWLMTGKAPSSEQVWKAAPSEQEWTLFHAHRQWLLKNNEKQPSKNSNGNNED